MHKLRANFTESNIHCQFWQCTKSSVNSKCLVFKSSIEYILSSSKNPFSFSIIRIILDCFHDLKLDWSLEMREPRKQILSFGIGLLLKNLRPWIVPKNYQFPSACKKNILLLKIILLRAYTMFYRLIIIIKIVLSGRNFLQMPMCLFSRSSHSI